jgi:outer membrane protein assembly factor BamB
VLVGDTLYYSTRAGDLHAVNGLTGNPVWENPTKLTAAKDRNGSPAPGIVAVDDKAVYAGSTDKNIYAVDRATGKLVADETKGPWVVDTGNSVSMGVTLAGTTLYASLGDRKIHAFNTQTREKLWSNGSADLGVSLSVRPAVDSGFVYIGTTNQKLTALDGEGRVKWSVDLPSIAGTPVIAGDLFYTCGGRALAIVKRTRTTKTEDGKEIINESAKLLHSIDLDERVDGTPTGPAVVTDGKRDTVYVPNGAGISALTWYLPPTLK